MTTKHKAAIRALNALRKIAERRRAAYAIGIDIMRHEIHAEQELIGCVCALLTDNEDYIAGFVSFTVARWAFEPIPLSVNMTIFKSIDTNLKITTADELVALLVGECEYRAENE
ncbi:MAG TPA: hypothetical protein PKU71_13585 [bacterium]|nr:hypothetical protein [bacterium]